jgi:integrating conjugative element protein (TIGR03752 family)
MPAIQQNKLIPILAIVALLVVGFTFWRIARDGEAAVPAGKPLEAVPAAVDPVKDATSGLLSGARSVRTTAADADTPTETIRTLTAQVSAMRNDMQQVTNENRQLYGRVAQAQLNKEQLKQEIKSELQASLPASASPATSAIPTTGQANGAAADKPAAGPMDGIFDKLPAGFGFDKPLSGAGTDPASTPNTPPITTRTILPLGVSVATKGANGQQTLVRSSFAPAPRFVATPGAESAMPSTGNGLADFADAGGIAKPGKTTKAAIKKDKPYFTIPENATLLGATALTALVGRIPVDGRVQDPMAFKLLLGPENLAANGHFLPRDLSGIVVSGIAIGDMNLSCSEGIVQSMTFVFSDGAIRTVSMRSNGTLSGSSSLLGGAGAATGQQTGLVQTPKLGYLSDRYGNPCISGEFKTNAPEYLASVVGLKTLSLAGKAAAMAETTTTSSSGFGGMSATSAVTGDRGRYVLGEAAAGATDEVTSWITRRMANSFDAVVTRAGADVVVHIDQPIAIDKTTDARYLDYGQDDADTARSLAKGSTHGLD